MTTTSASPLALVNARGQRISLGPPLAKGGEGVIYPIAGWTDLIAKVYHGPVSREKASKLAAMTRLSSERLRNIAAWPTDTLHDHPGGPVRGLLMPLVQDHQEIHVLYGPETRQRLFPDADFRFLIHTASNLARAFAAIHEHGHVIGDVNHGSVMVSKQGMVKLVDCDSFQIRFQQQDFLCLVGVPTHTPPELQGKSFANLVRTPDHDAFGLAVLIFQLLFLGRHPFSGISLGIGELSLERSIEQYRFAYGPGARTRMMKQPPATPTLDIGTGAVAALFERAFVMPGSGVVTRPSASEWVQALLGAANQLIRCIRHSGHYYPRGLASCPWCGIESSASLILFNVALVGTRTARDGPVFELTAIWAQITAIGDPGPPPRWSFPRNSVLSPAPAAKAQGVEMQRLSQVVRVALGAGSATALLALLLVSSFPALGIVLGIVAVGCLVVSFNARQHRQQDPARQKALHERDAARQQLRELEQRWKAGAGNAVFIEQRSELERQRDTHQGLPERWRRTLQEQSANARQHQLERFLDGQRIAGAAISNIGPGRKATLLSYGIETAADVTQSALLRVPGFGPTLTASLLSWRSTVEARFVFNPQRAIDPADALRIERDIASQRVLLEQSLQGGVPRLQRIVEQILATRKSLQAAGNRADTALAQAEADLRVL